MHHQTNSLNFSVVLILKDSESHLLSELQDIFLAGINMDIKIIMHLESGREKVQDSRHRY